MYDSGSGGKLPERTGLLAFNQETKQINLGLTFIKAQQRQVTGSKLQRPRPRLNIQVKFTLTWHIC